MTQPLPFHTLATISPNFPLKAWNSSKKGSISLLAKCESKKTPMSIYCDKVASCPLQQTVVDRTIRIYSRHRINCSSSSKTWWLSKGSFSPTSGEAPLIFTISTTTRSSITWTSAICEASSLVLNSLTSIARIPRCRSSLSSLSRWTRAHSAGWWSRMRSRYQVTIRSAAVGSRKVAETLATIRLSLLAPQGWTL